MRKGKDWIKPPDGKGKAPNTRTRQSFPRPVLQNVTNSTALPNRKRQAPEDDELDGPARPANKRAYITLKPYTKQFTTDTINTDWRVMPRSAQDQITSIVTRAKRMIVGRAGDLRKAAEIEQALDPLVKRLERRLPRMPYPPKTKDIHFDMDRMLERTRKLEAQITPTIHTQQLLEASTQEEEEKLQRDKADLRNFRKRVEKEQKYAQKHGVEDHPTLARKQETDDEPPDSADNIGLVATPSSAGELFDTRDPDIAPLVNQFSNHLASMRTNLLQFGNLDDIMIRVSSRLRAGMPQPKNTT